MSVMNKAEIRARLWDTLQRDEELPSLMISRPPWHDRAACRGKTSTMYSTKVDAIAEAKAVCSSCPVIADCRRWVDRWPQRFGVWAGLDADERRRARRVA